MTEPKTQVEALEGKMPKGLTYFPSILKSEDVKQEWKTSYSDARTNVSLATPLLAYMMFKCHVYFSRDPLIQTAAAMPWESKNLIFINPDFWMNTLKNTEERAFVLLHEVLHLFLEHSGRAIQNGYNHDLFNIATDYNINLVCSGAYQDDSGSIRHGRKYTLYFQRPSITLYKEKYIGMSSDEIYHQLLEENDNDAQKAIDSVMGEGDGQALDGVSECQPTKEQEVANRQAASAASSMAQASQSIGENEGELVRRLGEMNKPFVSWKDELSMAVMHSTKERPTYNRLSRRQGAGGIVFPSLTGSKIGGVFGFDSSGSMSENDYRDVGGELKGLLDQFEAWNIHLLTCDTRVHELGYYASEDGDDLSSMNFTAIGGGGTEMSPMVEFANNKEDEGEQINFCIIVTDGFIPIEPMEQVCRDDIVNIVVVTREGNKDLVLGNAKVIHMND